MSILKALQDYLETFDGMELRPIPQVLTDQTINKLSSYALAPSGNGKTVTYLDGSKTFENNYVFYARESALNEVDRQDNHDFLEDFSAWLEEDSGQSLELPGCEIDSVEVSNAMLFDVENGGTGLYQVQIKLIYTKGA